MKKFVLALTLLLSFNAVCSDTSNHHYYPTSFTQAVWSMNVKNNEMKNLIKDVLTKLHLEKDSKADTLVDKCQADQTCHKRKILSYGEARTYLFGKLHLKKDQHGYYIKDVYCDKTYDSETPNIKEIGPMIIPNANVINCEHTWPQSRFSTAHNTDEQKSDLHHLFPADNHANSVRGNYPFGEVSQSAEVSLCDTSSFGVYQTRKNRNSDTFFFEPPMEHRGNVARALFYFSVRYNLQITLDEEYYLRKWHSEDPVNEEELERNDEIYNIQFNRNPFIDYPFLVDLISDF